MDSRNYQSTITISDVRSDTGALRMHPDKSFPKSPISIQIEDLTTNDESSSGQFARIIVAILIAIVTIAVGFMFWWTLLATFDYSVSPVVVLDGQSVHAADFLTPGTNYEGISAEMPTDYIRPLAGHHRVPIVVRNGLRSVETTGMLYVLTPADPLFHEYKRYAPALQPLDVFVNSNIARRLNHNISFLAPPLPLSDYQVGIHNIYMELNGEPFTVTLSVVDTTAPTAFPRTLRSPVGADVTAESLVFGLSDASGVSGVYFVETPDFMQLGTQSVDIAIVDYFGNKAQVTSSLIIVAHDSPPVFTGVDTDISIMRGNSVAYRMGVNAFDSFGMELDFEVVSDSVDIHTLGTYTVLYSAIDHSGNQTIAERNVHVIDLDPDYVRGRVDLILAEILDSEMSQVDKVRAIFDWIRGNMFYMNVRGGPESVYEGALNALTRRGGNCVTYQSIGEVMLTRAGIPNMRVDRIEGAPTNHRWSLINPDGLGWHHFDSVPNGLALSAQRYMFTQTQAEEFSQILQAHGRSPMFYVFDECLFPEVVR